jgi:hypothetical protein
VNVQLCITIHRPLGLICITKMSHTCDSLKIFKTINPRPQPPGGASKSAMLAMLRV